MAISKIIDLVLKTGAAEKGIANIKKGLTEVDSKVDKVSNGSRFGKFGQGIANVTKKFRVLGLVLKGSGIMLLAGIIGSITQAFKNSEAGQDRFNKIMLQINTVLGNMTDIVANLGNALLDTFGALLKGDFKGAFNAISTGFSNTYEQAKNLREETERELELASKIADTQAAANKLERELIVQRAEANRQRADLLEKAVDKENYSAEQRIAFLQEAGRLEEEITKKEIEAARMRYEAKVQENTLSGSTKEDLDEEAQLKARLIDLETARLRKQKAVTAQVSAARKEQEAANKAEQAAIDAEEKRKADEAAKAADEAAKAETARQDAIDAIQEAYKIKREDKAAEEAENAEMAKIELEEARALAELERLDATEAQKADIIAFYADKKQAVKDGEAEKELALDQQVKDAKKKMAMDGLALLSQVAGEGSKVGKAVALTQTIISGIEGVQNAYKTAQDSPITTVFPAYPIIQAGLAAGFAAAQASAIKRTPITAKGSGGGSVNVPRSTPNAPSFNVVGAAPENQLAQALGQQEKEPVKAYVVSNEVTNAQALDRNIVESASLG